MAGKHWKAGMFGAASGGAAAGSAMGGASLVMASSPAANLGGYAVAQVAAKAIGVGAGPALSTTIAAVGGPVVVAGAGVLAAAVVVGGVAYGISRWLTD